MKFVDGCCLLFNMKQMKPVGFFDKNFFLYFEETDYCYIGSAPIDIDIPEGKQRGMTYILVYRVNKNKDVHL